MEKLLVLLAVVFVCGVLCWLEAFVLAAAIRRFGRLRFWGGVALALAFLVVTVHAMFSGWISPGSFLLLHSALQACLFWLLRHEVLLGVKTLVAACRRDSHALEQGRTEKNSGSGTCKGRPQDP